MFDHMQNIFKWQRISKKVHEFKVLIGTNAYY